MWVLIPIKRFAEAKTRLAAAFQPPQRAALAQALAAIAMRAALGARGVSRVVALTADPAARRLARKVGVEIVAESGLRGNLNSLLTVAIDSLARAGASRLLYLASDLPDLKSACLEQLMARHESGVSIGRAARDGGTNALLFEAPRRFTLAFGPDSANAHLSNARTAGLPAQLLHIPGISNDLDTPELAPARLRSLLRSSVLSGAA